MPQKDKEAYREYQKKYNRLHPERSLARHHVSFEKYADMLEKQNGVCAVCGKVDTKQRLSIDHDHKHCAGQYSCGKCIRGLLCNRCNRVLGKVGDSIELLLSFVNYLKIS